MKPSPPRNRIPLEPYVVSKTNELRLIILQSIPTNDLTEKQFQRLHYKQAHEV